MKRTFNGVKASIHDGVDLRAAIGNFVKAVNNGVVRFTKSMFFGGNVVIIDHGGEIFSSYSHLSEFKVVPGQMVKKGEIVGLAGRTGRVNAPHLHAMIIVNKIKVNPIQFYVLSSKHLEFKTDVR